MNPVFSIGIESLWDEVSHMPVGGVWWINVDRRKDAIDLLNQTVSAQAKEAKVSAILTEDKPREIIKLSDSGGPETLSLFSMPNRKEALYSLHRDLLCSIDPQNRLFILLCAEYSWENISANRIRKWLQQSQQWVKYHRCTLLILYPGNNNDTQLSLLLREYRSLSGLARLRYQGDSALFDIAYWGNEKGMSAHQQVQIHRVNNRWKLTQDEQTQIQPRSDEKDVLSNKTVLEGAPPLSEHWHLFDTNDGVFDAGLTAQAATLIFSLTQTSQIEQLAQYIHTLRRQRGTALKIVVRESISSLRVTDERLLLRCGANLVIPCSASLSRSLTLIESVQNQQFQRHIPDDIGHLLAITQPLKLRGYQKWDVFCNAVHDTMSNPLLPSEGKGVMVALRPAPGLRVEQALTLCRPNRPGDIMTIGDNRLVLFLTFCRINDLDAALNNIFPLPTGDIFSNRMVWYDDKQILAEILDMRAVTPDNWTAPLPVTVNNNNVPGAVRVGHHWRRLPEPHRLDSGAREPQS